MTRDPQWDDWHDAEREPSIRTEQRRPVMSRLPNCAIVRCGMAFVSGNWWACACGRAAKASSPESAQYALETHKERKRDPEFADAYERTVRAVEAYE